MPQVQRAAAQALRQGRSGLQGQRFLPHRQPRIGEDREQRLGVQQRVVEFVDLREVVGQACREVQGVRQVVEFLRLFGQVELEFVVELEYRRSIQLSGYPQVARRPLPQWALAA